MLGKSIYEAMVDFDSCQDGFYPIAGIRSILGSRMGRAFMADAPIRNVDLKEKAISAAGAAVISAVLVNPLDVAKVSFQSLYLWSFFTLLWKGHTSIDG